MATDKIIKTISIRKNITHPNLVKQIVEISNQNGDSYTQTCYKFIKEGIKQHALKQDKIS